MRKVAVLCGVVMFIAAVSPIVRAQFQQPNPDELEMTSDPKAPGAAAVFLEIRESNNDPMHYRRYCARIKVLLDKGKELATIEIPYFKNGAEFQIVDIKGRTIHADGTVIPLTVKPEDLLVAKTGEEQIQRKVFTLPSVEVGSVLEYSYELTYNPRLFATPTWEVQRRYFVHNAHYDFTPFKGFLPGARDQLNAFLIDSSGRTLDHLVWWWWLPNGMTVTQENVLGRFSLDINDVPPIPTEAWMPPDSSVAYSVEFYYTYATSAENFWIQAAKDWSKETDRFAEPSSAIRDAVGGLIASSDSDIEKAKKLYNAVQALDNTDYSRARSESERKDLKLKPVKTAQGVWAQKGGTSEELALLYLSMLRSAGLTAYSFKVVDRSRGVFDPSYMSINQLNATVVILSTGGKEILLDPGVKMCPFQTIDWRHSGAEGLRQTANGPSRAVTPYQNFGANIVKRTGTIQLDEHGGATGTIEIEMTGQQALIWRRLAIEVDESELKKRFDKEIGEVVPADVEAHVDHFVALDQPDATLTAVVKVNGTLGTPAGKRLILPAFLFEGRGGEPFVDQEMRQEPVDMHFGGQVRDQLTYSLPSDMTVEGAPQDTSESWENHATYIVRTKSGTGEITVARLIANAFTMAQPQEYKNLRGFYAKVASSDQGQLVLAIGTGTKGN